MHLILLLTWWKRENEQNLQRKIIQSVNDLLRTKGGAHKPLIYVKLKLAA